MSLIPRIKHYGWNQGFGLAILDDGRRIHLWHPKWSNTDIPFIHSHSYHFTSKMLIGKMDCPEYRVELNPKGKQPLVTGSVTEERMNNPDWCDLILVDRVKVQEGEEYEFGGPARFHVTDSKDLVMTLFTVLPIPAVKGSGFIIPKDWTQTAKTLAPRPNKPELKTEMLRLLEKYDL